MMTSARLPLHTSSFSGNKLLPNLMFLVAFVAGIVVGNFGRLSTQSDLGPQRGIVLQVNDIPFRNTSHIDDQGRPIVKQQLIEPFAIPNFVGVSIATFQPGQTMMPVHEHKSLHEFFYVLSGQGIIQKDGMDHKVSAGTFLHMAPYEKHGIWVSKDSAQEMKMLVCGVTVSSTK
jgi:quercetin dioxygenase-like cupin family protein